MIVDEKKDDRSECFVLDAYFFVTEHGKSSWLSNRNVIYFAEWTPQQGSATYYVDKRPAVESAVSNSDKESCDGSETSDNDGAPVRYGEKRRTFAVLLQMISITPQRNTLALVYRDTGIDTFVKYVNCTARGDFDQFALQYTPLE